MKAKKILLMSMLCVVQPLVAGDHIGIKQGVCTLVVWTGMMLTTSGALSEVSYRPFKSFDAATQYHNDYVAQLALARSAKKDQQEDSKYAELKDEESKCTIKKKPY